MNILNAVNDAIALTKKSKNIGFDRKFASTKAEAEQILPEVFQNLQNFYLELNMEYKLYLSRKVDEYSFVSQLDETKLTKEDLEKIKTHFLPVNKYYVDEMQKIISEASRQISGFRSFKNKIEKQTKPLVKEEFEKNKKFVRDSIMVSDEKIEFLAPHVRGFMFRADKVLDSKSDSQQL